MNKPGDPNYGVKEEELNKSKPEPEKVLLKKPSQDNYINIHERRNKLKEPSMPPEFDDLKKEFNKRNTNNSNNKKEKK